MSANSSIDLDDTDIFRGTLVVLSALSLGVFIITQAVNGTTRNTALPLAEDNQSAATAEVSTPSSSTSTQRQVKSAAAVTQPKAPSVKEKTAPALGSVTTEKASNSSSSKTVPPSITTTTAELRDTSEYVVNVLNGARIGGIARKVNNTLHAKSFVTSFPGNTSLPVDQSTILHLEGYEQEAKEVAEALDVADSFVAVLDESNKPVNNIGDADIIVVIGRDGKIG